MRLLSVRLRNFRNHAESFIEFGEGVNFLIGGNGEGKTSVLEAISYFGLTKSFFSAPDVTTLRRGEDQFEIEGNLVTGSGTSEHVFIRFDRPGGEKRIGVNRSVLDRHNHLIGRFPVVVLSPESGRITAGAPGERRRFLDMVLAQRSRSYLEDLLEYRKVLRQRNRLLFEAKTGRPVTSDMLRPWTEHLATLGSRITERRMEFVAEFLPVLVRVHRTIANDREQVSVEYNASVPLGEKVKAEAIARSLREVLAETEQDERRRGTTLAGPHRDDLALSINGMSAPEHASQGQHKTLLLAMKIAEFEYLGNALEEVPVLLLDDLFSELDADRSARIIRLVAGLGQSLVTATSDGLVQSAGTDHGLPRTILVEQGSCRMAS